MPVVNVDFIITEVTNIMTPGIYGNTKFKSDLFYLRNKIGGIRAMLEDAEAKQLQMLAIRDWLRKLKDATFEIENILDEVSTEAMIRRVDSESGIVRIVGSFFSARNPIAFRSRMAHKAKNLRQRLDEIAADGFKFGLTHVSKDEGFVDEPNGIVTRLLVDEPGIVGRDLEKEMIIRKICDEGLVNQGDDVSVYAIRGMGGVGKTTLCRLVYNDPRATEHFDLKMWVCVSEKFEVQRLIKDILGSVDKSSSLTELELLQQCLQEIIGGKRFLLVLDDVWLADPVEWEKLKEGLKCGASGSIVMLTTRSLTTARMMAENSEFIHHIGCLSHDESWSLFTMFAFGPRRTRGNIDELEEIGKAIIERCQGLPLALKALGSVMQSKRSVSQWVSVLKSDLWDISLANSAILPALKLCYESLPHVFRQCFAYCSVFPRDYVMSKDLMIKLWIANRFIPSTEGEDSYKRGEEIFAGLVRMSFFQDVVVDTTKDIETVTCKMHDLMHDLAQSVTKHECLIIEPGKELEFRGNMLHHVSSLSGLPTNEELARVRSLQSIIMLDHEEEKHWVSMLDINKEKNGSIPNQIFKQRYLRVLDLRKTQCMKLPNSICNLIHLRYLNLSWSKVQVLPKSIIYLQNLQTLNLRGCARLRKLPQGMRHMKNLQFLEIKGCYGLEKMPSRMGQLTGLRRLSRFIVGAVEDGEGITELGELNLLGWELDMVGLEKVSGLEEADGAKLKFKRNLISLSLRWSIQEPCENGEGVLEGLEPHLNLKKLEINWYRGLKFASWIVNLVNLVELKLDRCCELEILPQLGRLPVLRVLKILGMDALKSFDDDDNVIDLYNTTSSSSSWGRGGKPSAIIRFPSLEMLDISYCQRLIGLPSNLPKLEDLSIHGCYDLVSLPDSMGMGSFSSLSHLSIYKCPKLNCLPDGLPNIATLQSVYISDCELLAKRFENEIGEDWPKIAHVPYVTIDQK